MSTTKLLYHIVFATWHRRQTITANHERALYAFINNFSQKRGVKCVRIGGMPDHVHVLRHIPATMTVAEYVKVLKSESSKFLTLHDDFPYWEKWAEGYFATTVSPADAEAVRQYIMNQKPHHTTKPFADEYREFLIAAGLQNEMKILGDT